MLLVPHMLVVIHHSKPCGHEIETQQFFLLQALLNNISSCFGILFHLLFGILFTFHLQYTNLTNNPLAPDIWFNVDNGPFSMITDITYDINCVERRTLDVFPDDEHPIRNQTASFFTK